MAARKPKSLIVENNSAVVGKFPVVRFVDPADEQRYQCRWVRTTTGAWTGTEYDADAHGYVPVDPAEVGMQRFGRDVSNEGTVVRFAEYILMKCDKQQFVERQLQQDKNSIALQNQIDRDTPKLNDGHQRVVPMSTQYAT